MNQRPFFDRFVSRLTLPKSASSRFDKFNHVKYTKTLSVRNPHTVFFMRFTGEPAITSTETIAAITFDSFLVLLGLQKQARKSMRITLLPFRIKPLYKGAIRNSFLCRGDPQQVHLA